MFTDNDRQTAAHTPLLPLGDAPLLRSGEPRLAWVAKVHGTPIVPALLLGKALIYPLFLYVWIIPRYSDEFYYYRNLGICRRTLLGVSCAVDFGLCCLLLNYSAALLHAAR